MVEQLQTEPRGRLAGAHQLYCSVLWMQRSEVKQEGRVMFVCVGGVRDIICCIDLCC